MRNKKSVSFAISESTHHQLVKLAQVMKRSKSNTLEVLVDDAFKKLSIEQLEDAAKYDQ